MSTTLYLVRHASHDRVDHILCGRIKGVHLGAAGREQASRLAAFLGGRGITAVFSSPQPRALETAEPVAEATRTACRVRAELDEIDFGEWTGMPFAALETDPRWAVWNENRLRAAPPGGERFDHVAARTAAWLHSVVADHPDAAVTAVSHADVIKAAICGLIGLPLDHYARLDIAPASVTTLRLWPGGGKLHAMNEAPAA